MKLQLQPIETAPRDGTQILGFNRVHSPMICRWKTDHGWMEVDDDPRYREPIYWHPLDYELPPKPKTVIEEVEELRSAIRECPLSNTSHAKRDAYSDVINILRKHEGEVI